MIKVAIVGTGYVGTVAAVAFSAIGNEVVGIESDPHKLDSLEKGTAPFHEPTLDEHLREQVATGRLRFTADMASGVSTADVVFLCVGTPPDITGRPDLTALRTAAPQVAAALADHTVVITKSTVPIGWAEELRSLLHDAAPHGAQVDVVSNPEFLREGSALHDFLYPDRVVLGGDSEDALDMVYRLYRPILEQTFSGGYRSHQPALIRTDLATAETIKYAANGFLATKIAYINEIARICDNAGADVETVAEAVGLDHRIERKFLGAGIGFGGSCFEKDLLALEHYGIDHGLDLQILRAVNPSNITQRLQIVTKLADGLGGLDGKRIAVLGLAYKPNTDDVREAPSVSIVESLVDAGASVVAFDPVVKHLDEVPDLATAADAYDAVTGADAAVLLTEWKEFGGLDFRLVAQLMAGDLVVDGRNWLDRERISAAGLRYVAMGRRAAAT